MNILRDVIKGFDIAYPRDAYRGSDTGDQIKGAEVARSEADEWNNPRHPTNPKLRVLDSYPVVPDLDGVPETGSYIITKFHTNPVAQTDTYDDRLDVGLFKPSEENEEDQERQRTAQAAQETDRGVAIPVPTYNYDYFLPKKASSVRGIKRKVNPAKPDHDDDEYYDAVRNDGARCFHYDRLRAYETYQQTGNINEQYQDSVMIALHDPEVSAELEGSRKLQKAAYYYPILAKMFIRPKRAPNAVWMGLPGRQPQRSEDQIDAIEATIRDPTEDENSLREKSKGTLLGLLSAEV